MLRFNYTVSAAVDCSGRTRLKNFKCEILPSLPCLKGKRRWTPCKEKMCNAVSLTDQLKYLNVWQIYILPQNRHQMTQRVKSFVRLHFSIGSILYCTFNHDVHYPLKA